MALRTLRTHERWTRAQIDAHQQEALAALRAFARHASPFYQQFYRGYETAPLAELPVLTKRILMDNFDSFVTDRSLRLSDVRAHVDQGSVGSFHRAYEVVATSGSTGMPGIFLFNSGEWATIMASFARAREWAGIKLQLTRRSRMVVVSSTNERNVSARVGRAADTPFIPTLRLDATTPLSDIVMALNEWQPEVLVGYASMVHFLAAEQVRGALDIHPRAVFASSEVLTKQMRQRIISVWDDVVFDEYASTETAMIAAEDVGHHGMHLFEDLLIVENVDANNQPVPPGSFGEKLLVTVLFSRTQPLIRYEISDSVRFAESAADCRLPFQVVDAVQGRQEDILLMPGPSGGLINVHPNVFHDVMDAIPNRGWQVVQEQDCLEILVMPAGIPDPDKVRASVAAALGAHGITDLRTTVRTVDAIPKSVSGKSPLIKAYRPPEPTRRLG